MTTVRTLRLMSAAVVLALVAGLTSLLAGLPTPPRADAAGANAPGGLTVDQRTSPADLPADHRPLLGWQPPTARQTGYQVQVAESQSALASGRRVWDSGKVTSDRSTNVRYTGPALADTERYVWRVRTWDEEDRRSSWSSVHQFGTAPEGSWGDSTPIWLPSAEAAQWRDYTLETRFRVDAQNATIVFNAQDPEHYLMWQLRGNGVNTLAPHVRDGGTFTVLKSVPLGTTLETGAEHDLRLEVAGATVRTYLDDRLVDTTTDVPYTQGTIGFRTGGSERNSWDHLTVTSATGEVLYTNDYSSHSDLSCAGVADGWLQVGTGANCVYGLDTDWAFLRGELRTAPGKEVRWATVFATGASPEPGSQYVYKLWLNGDFVGLGPTRSVAGETRFDGFDITDKLRADGPNAFGALAWTQRDHSFQAYVVVEYADGSRQVFGTGPHWKVRNGSSVFPWAGSIGTGYFTAPKEDLQAAAYPHGFDRPGFDDSGWAAAEARPAYDDLQPTPTQKVEQETRLPVEVVEKSPGHYFIDYGRTWIGGLQLALAGSPGQRVELRFGEELSAPQTVRYAMRTGNTYQDRWTLSGEKQRLETWGMRVFRYAEVVGAPSGLGKRDFPALVQLYPFDTEGAVFESSDDRLNQVWRLSRNTIEALNHNLYVDSWTRERVGYEADSYLQMMANFFVSSDPTLGNYSIEYLLTRRTWPTEWPLYLILAMHDSYQQTGDIAQLERSYDQLVDKLPTQWLEEETGLIRKDQGSDGCNSRTDCDIVDWPASERDGFVFRPYNTVINALAYRTFADMANIATATGHDADAREFADTAERLRAAINEHMWDEEKGAYRDGLNADRTPVQHWASHASVFASAFGVPDDDQADRVAEYLGQRGMQCSVYCAAFLIESLYNGDRSDLAFDLLTDDGLRSWMNMIENGAGATAEAWDVSLKSNMTWSHPWAASPAYNVPQGMFGIQPIEPGYSEFRVRPQPQSVAWAHVTLPTLRGRIGAAFHTVGDRTDVGVWVPGNSEAEVHVPAPGLADGEAALVYVDGKARTARAERGHLQVAGLTRGCHTLSLAAGGAPARDKHLTAVCPRGHGQP